MTLAEELIWRSNFRAAMDRWNAYVDAMGMSSEDIRYSVDPTEVRLWNELRSLR